MASKDISTNPDEIMLGKFRESLRKMIRIIDEPTEAGPMMAHMDDSGKVVAKRAEFPLPGNMDGLTVGVERLPSSLSKSLVLLSEAQRLTIDLRDKGEEDA